MSTEEPAPERQLEVQRGGRTARFWLGTLYDWTPPQQLPDGVCWIRGQQETCPSTQRVHHQVCAGFNSPVRLAAVKRKVGIFHIIKGNGHWEISRSSAARDYVWKEDTRVAGTQFELGTLPVRRNEKCDWDSVRASAKSGDLDAVPADIFIR